MKQEERARNNPEELLGTLRRGFALLPKPLLRHRVKFLRVL
jgi:hypothetical protein